MHYSITMVTKRVNMATLTVTERGQVTFRKDVLQHLGIEPGGKIEVELLPGGRGIVKAAQKKGSIDNFIGSLAGKSKVKLTIKQIKKATERAWAGER
jgi:bifunctional DNA-binding transcriptional regulator/antitoxin component of YhaV-PrlF toxin-antitoxin module